MHSPEFYFSDKSEEKRHKLPIKSIQNIHIPFLRRDAVSMSQQTIQKNQESKACLLIYLLTFYLHMCWENISWSDGKLHWVAQDCLSSPVFKGHPANQINLGSLPENLATRLTFVSGNCTSSFRWQPTGLCCLVCFISLS